MIGNHPSYIVKREPRADPDAPSYLRVRCRRCSLSWLLPEDEWRRTKEYPTILREHAAKHEGEPLKPMARGAYTDARGEPTNDHDQGYWSRRADQQHGVEDALALVDKPAERMAAAHFIEIAMVRWGVCQIIVRKKPEVCRDDHGEGEGVLPNGRGPMEDGGQNMGIGKRAPAFMPSAKWDAKAGRFYVFNREQVDGQWTTVKADVTEDFAAIFDLENVETGYIRFPEKAAPEAVLAPAAEDRDLGPPPSKDHKQGVRIICRIADDPAGPREILSTSAAFWNAIDTLHDDYLAGLADHPGQLPVAVLASVQVTETTNGTSAQPVFEIIEWVKRPVDMPRLLAPRAKPTRKDDMSDSIPF
jgi:hypothetical protein